MNEVFEKILDRLEELKLPFPDDCPSYNGDTNALIDNIKQIVQEVAEEYNGGWIPCSERMPEEQDSMFAKLKGTDKWNNNMFEKRSNEVNVTIVNDKGSRVVTHAITIDGKWSCELLKMSKTLHVIAWQPLPEPFNKNNITQEERSIL